MLSIDTNILFHGFDEDSPRHAAALAWLVSISGEEEVAISELTRKLYDARSALTMTSQGVTEFATVNVKDFEGLGFRKVWNLLAA